MYFIVTFIGFPIQNGKLMYLKKNKKEYFKNSTDVKLIQLISTPIKSDIVQELTKKLEKFAS